MPRLILAAALMAAAGPAAAAPLPPLEFAWTPRGLHAVTTAPGRVTDIVLEPGEALVGSGPVAAGDTARWVIGQSESGAGAARRVHVLVKPTAPDLATNLIVNTDRRTYRLELRSTAAAWTPSVSWRYPPGELTALAGAPATAAPAGAQGGARTGPGAAVILDPAPAEPSMDALNFAWRIEGRAPFRPLRVFDDGRRTYIDFPPQIARREMPPLFVLPDRGEAPLLVNVRVRGTRMIVDRVPRRAELRLGAGKAQARVRLEREAAP